MSAPNYNTLYTQLFQHNPPQSLERGTSSAPILRPASGFMSAFDWTMQVQVGCPAGCRFCYVSTAHRLAPAQVRGQGGDRWGYVVRDKLRIAQKLQKALQSKSLAQKSIYWSPITDPYAAPPAMTREIWHTLLASEPSLRPNRIAVQTRFAPERDLDLLRTYATSTPTSDTGPPLVFSYSLGTDRDDLIRSWERATPLFARRMKTIRALCDAGLYVVVTFSPLGLWNHLEETLHTLRDLGVAYVTCLPFKRKTRSADTPPSFLDYLETTHPELLDPAWQTERIAAMRAVFGEGRVLCDQAGFASLAQPHAVYPRRDV